MLNQTQVNSLNIKGKNTLKDDSEKNLSQSITDSYSLGTINNFILNSNLENGSSIK